ncbi:hypothetical protein M6D93_12515 [Jatrophihabitans telluris]|uniref:DUF4410 domain-containing protein n=1 Tax=Jatrophihabitans telluris TaxID=2038343 RepID=A0ABY4QWC5_9ACTN|nr:hypothetical protein [Jatrophihabitans telluris]UQX87121.1 hypothetical protein M6D93_12515 [Jatrophihabitans telluris]
MLNAPVIGQTAYIVGVPQTDIGRVAYLNCKYGITKTKVKKKTVTTTKIEVGISLYGTSQQALDRVAGTVDAYRLAGSTTSDAGVGQFSGTILMGGGELPTLVVAAGPRTVAVTVVGNLVASSKLPTTLERIAKAALDATTRFNQAGPGATASASASASAGSS